MPEKFLKDWITLHCGDCLDVLKTLPDNSIDSCVTDPPYHLTSCAVGWETYSDGKGGNKAGNVTKKGFMGKTWDGGDVAFRVETWQQVYRVLKPGAHLLAFGGTRTYHRMACAIEDAGFEIRDTILYLYGSGFPKSHNIGNGFGTALKPACEPIVLARKPLSEGTIAANVLKHGTGALNIDGCRVGTEKHLIRSGRGGDVAPWQLTRIDEERIGRFPANLIHDGSEEVVRGFPESDGGAASGYNWAESNNDNPTHIARNIKSGVHFGDNGSAARFFYTAKADSDDRLGSKHPTVKPLDLMQYLVRLVTPKGATVLDPFAGTGTAGEAAWREGMRAVLIEREAEYQTDIRRRMKLCMAGPDERSRESIKQRTKDKPMDHGPLFSEEWQEMWSKPFSKPELL